MEIESLDLAVRQGDAHEAVAPGDEAEARALLNHLPGRAEDVARRDPKRPDTQPPADAEIPRALVPAVVEPRDLDRDAGERDREIRVGEREVADLLGSIGDERQGRGRRVSVRVENGQ